MALALHLGHLQSVDFDCFAHCDLDLERIALDIPLVVGANIVQRDKNTLTVIVDRGGPVKVSFFGVPRLPQLATAARDVDLDQPPDLPDTLAVGDLN